VSSGAQPCFGAIFDWDGVIIDSGQLHAQSWRLLAAELGKAIAPDSFIRGFGMKSAWIIAEIHGWASDPAEIARLEQRKEALYREIVARSDIAPLPGVVEWLDRLSAADVPCAVASSTHRLNINAVLDRIGLKSAFREIVSAEDVTHGKPNPEVFATAAERIGVGAERCVVFEDAHVGIEAAHAAGMKVVAVATTHPVEQLTAADLVVRRLDELQVEQVAALLDHRATGAASPRRKSRRRAPCAPSGSTAAPAATGSPHPRSARVAPGSFDNSPSNQSDPH
jgi:beta-phosphoglucomutase family hydrolase